jgi:uncharacterized protein
MGERTEYAPGTFSWADLPTPDGQVAKDFYGDLLGWEAEDHGVPGGGTYSVMKLRGKRVAAIYESEQPPAWLSYVTVERADDAAARAAELGATVMSEPFDVLDAGRMAVVQDGQGAVFAVWEPRAQIGAELVNEAGAMAWNQLTTPDVEAAKELYAGLFGWTWEEAGDDYWLIRNGGSLNGGVSSGPQASWTPLFTVDDLGAGVGKAPAVLVPPSPIEGGQFAVLQDPAGAVFGLFAGKVDP